MNSKLELILSRIPRAFSVAQIVNLPYRRLAVGARSQVANLRYSRLTVCATVLALIIGLSAFVADSPGQPDKTNIAASSGKTLYTCGMHPWIIQDHPGNCPICGMKLEPVHKQADGVRRAGQRQDSVLQIHDEAGRDQPGAGQGQHGHGHGAGVCRASGRAHRPPSPLTRRRFR